MSTYFLIAEGTLAVHVFSVFVSAAAQVKMVFVRCICMPCHVMSNAVLQCSYGMHSSCLTQSHVSYRSIGIAQACWGCQVFTVFGRLECQGLILDVMACTLTSVVLTERLTCVICFDTFDVGDGHTNRDKEVVPSMPLMSAKALLNDRLAVHVKIPVSLYFLHVGPAINSHMHIPCSDRTAGRSKAHKSRKGSKQHRMGQANTTSLVYITPGLQGTTYV